MPGESNIGPMKIDSGADTVLGYHNYVVANIVSELPWLIGGEELATESTANEGDEYNGKNI